MGKREVVIKQSAAESIAEIAWFIESKGVVKTAEKFADNVYDFIEKLADDRRRPTVCRDPARAEIGYKCIAYKRKYTIVLLESDEDVTICEFIPSRLISW